LYHNPILDQIKIRFSSNLYAKTHAVDNYHPCASFVKEEISVLFVKNQNTDPYKNHALEEWLMREFDEDCFML